MKTAAEADNGAAPHAPVPDPLDAPDAGARVVRGGAMRAAALSGAILVNLLAAPLLLRHLGPVAYGGFATVLSLIGIATVFSEAGLTVVGVREYAVRDGDGRRRLMVSLVTLRLASSLVAGLVAVGFAVIAGYSAALVLGTVLASVGLILFFLQQSYMVPLSAQLRYGAIASLDFLRQALTAILTVALVALGASVAEFLAIPIPVGLVVGAITLVFLRGHMTFRVGLDRSELRQLARAGVAVAGATIMAAAFYRVALIIVSLVSTQTETGYFAASQRIVEVLLPFMALLNSAPFPLLSRAAQQTGQRLAAGLQRVFEVNVVIAGWTALMLVLGARPIILFLGGSEFEGAIEVLRIQAFAIALMFLSAAWGTALIAVEGQRALFWATALGVLTAAPLTVVLAQSHGARGAAAAMLIAEVVRATATGVALLRPRAALRPRLAIVWKLVLALGLAAPLGLIGIPAILACIAATVVYFGVLALGRALPPELRDAVAGVGRKLRAG
jgi:O-antigen/teichoic acid export membrane protein